MQGHLTFPRHTLSTASHRFNQNYNDFIYFANETKGVSGRPVKIHRKLLVPFLSLVDATNQQGQATIRAIINLRATAGHLTSQQSLHNSFDHLLTVGKVSLRYRIASDESGGKGTVYITDVKSNYKDSGGSGLYNVVGSSGRPVIKKAESNRVAHSAVYLNGSVGKRISVEDAADVGMIACKKNAFAMVYSSGSAINDMGAWRQSTVSSWQRKKLVSELTDVLEMNASEVKEWFVEGEGASLLLEALATTVGNDRKDLGYSNKKLNNYKFHIINPIADTPKLLSILRQKNANLDAEPIKYDGTNKAANLNLYSHYGELMQRLSSLGNNSEYNKNLMNAVNANLDKGALASFKGGSGGTCFCDIIASVKRSVKK